MPRRPKTDPYVIEGFVRIRASKRSLGNTTAITSADKPDLTVSTAWWENHDRAEATISNWIEFGADRATRQWLTRSCNGRASRWIATKIHRSCPSKRNNCVRVTCDPSCRRLVD